MELKAPRNEDCIFCKIVEDKEQHIVNETGTTLAFLDHKPLFPGHILLIPKDHYETIMTIPDSLIAELFFQTKLLAKALQSALRCEGIFIANNNIISQSVPHLHIHIVPRNKKDGLKGFFWPRHPYGSEAEMTSILTAIKTAISRMR